MQGTKTVDITEIEPYICVRCGALFTRGLAYSNEYGKWFYCSDMCFKAHNLGIFF